MTQGGIELRLAITGYSGFLGTHLISRVGRSGTVAIGRSDAKTAEYFFKHTLNPEEDFSDCLYGVGCLIHVAARTHVMKEIVSNPLAEYRQVNVDDILNLSRQVAKAEV